MQLSGLQWMKGMGDKKRQTEGIQSIQGPKLREKGGHYIFLQFSRGLVIRSKWTGSEWNPPDLRSAQSGLGAARTGATRLRHLADAVATSHTKPGYNCTKTL